MQILTWYGPLLKAVFSPLMAFGSIMLFHWRYYPFSVHFFTYANWFWFSSGVFYTHIFEYLYHRFALHTGLPGLQKMKEGHRTHHRIFHPLNYKTRNPADLREITTRWYIFPILLSIHYFIFITILPENWLIFAIPFFSGITLRFLVYDTTHYFSHLADNFFDRWVAKIPLLKVLRAYQDRHHCYHHLRQGINFGFVPDYLPDWIGRTLFPK